MIILTIRTDKPEAEIGLYDGGTQLAYDEWAAHRHLAETIHSRIADLLAAQDKGIHDIQGIVVFQGPGSFTGLRIGLTVANALAMGLDARIVAVQGEDWRVQGIRRLAAGDNDYPAQPHYGAPVHITPQKR